MTSIQHQGPFAQAAPGPHSSPAVQSAIHLLTPGLGGHVPHLSLLRVLNIYWAKPLWYLQEMKAQGGCATCSRLHNLGSSPGLAGLIKGHSSLQDPLPER